MKKKLPLFCLALLAMLAFSCQKEPSSSDDSDSEDEIVGDMLSDKQLEILENLNMPLYDGDNPPNITGYYHTDNFDCVASTDDAKYSSELQNLDYYWNFHNKDGQNIDLDYFNDGSDEATGTGAYIFGEGNNFTVYIETNGKTGTNTTYTMVSVYCGTKTSSGISNFRQGFILTSKKNDTSNKLMDVNEARVFLDDFAEILTSNPGFSSIRYDAAIDMPMFLAASSK